MQIVAARFAFGPQPAFRAAEECDAAFGHRFVECLFVEVAQHQDLTRVVVLNDGGNQSLAALGCVQFAEFYHNLTVICCSYNCRLSDGMGISP